MSDEEITGVHDLPLQVRPFAVSISSRHNHLSKKVEQMSTKLDAVHDVATGSSAVLRFIAWAVGVAVVLLGALLTAHLATGR